MYEENEKIKLSDTVNVEIIEHGLYFTGKLYNKHAETAIDYFTCRGYSKWLSRFSDDHFGLNMKMPVDPSRDYATMVPLQCARDLINYIYEYNNNLIDVSLSSYEVLQKHYELRGERVNLLQNEIGELQEKIHDLEDKVWKYRQERNAAMAELEER